MALLIDGYNLLHATGLFGRGQGRGGFERSRRALLEFLGARLEPAERQRTTVVFDAAQAPPGLADRLQHEGILVRFARGYPAADDLLEELIAADHTPRQLVVVSSDHRVQRAARRRRAMAVDSEPWYRAMCQRGGPQDAQSVASAERPQGLSLAPLELEYWLQQFAVDEAALAPEPFVPRRPPLVRPAPEPLAGPGATPAASPRVRRPKRSAAPPPPDPKERKLHWHEVWNDVFPPGYAEDLWDDEE